jgi:hypothetical protein
VASLKVSDIDSKCMLLRVEQGKGRQGSLRDTTLPAVARSAARPVAHCVASRPRQRSRAAGARTKHSPRASARDCERSGRLTKTRQPRHGGSGVRPQSPTGTLGVVFPTSWRSMESWLGSNMETMARLATARDHGLTRGVALWRAAVRVRPGFQILDGVDDPAAMSSVVGSNFIHAHISECAAFDAQKRCGFLGGEIWPRYSRHIVGSRVTLSA